MGLKKYFDLNKTNEIKKDVMKPKYCIELC